ncbi:hypothetical protein [Methylocaldum sp.]|uniref:hypothetical protein n=1 Tax=Methylocaldum sp. TaxID=1969727 RepID=UPI002D3AA5D6|nr:hypothetical protein [Methylocaldum sp.]HYE38175.1 hypothetical protein [Methylocaldum sp.]
MPQAPVLGVAELNDLRRRVLAGEQVSTEELAAGIKAIRQGRASAMAAKAKAPAKRKKKLSEEEAEAELDNLLGGIGLGQSEK